MGKFVTELKTIDFRSTHLSGFHRDRIRPEAIPELLTTSRKGLYEASTIGSY